MAARKRKPGRPKLPKGQEREAVLTIRLKPSERVAIVAVRIHRAQHYAAFTIPASPEVRIQDDVTVNFG